jgi:hypothetical protein
MNHPRRHPVLTILLRRTLTPSPAATVSRQRRSLASGLERLAAEAHRTPSPTRAALPPIIRRDVAAAVAGPAAVIAAELRDPAVPVDDATLQAIRAFLTDGWSSPLYDRDPAAAVLAVADLERRVRRPHVSTVGRAETRA